MEGGEAPGELAADNGKNLLQERSESLVQNHVGAVAESKELWDTERESCEG